MGKIKSPPFIALLFLPVLYTNMLYAQDSTSIQIDNIKLHFEPTYTIPADLQLSPKLYKFDLKNDLAPVMFNSTGAKDVFDKKNIQLSYTGNRIQKKYLGLGNFEQFNNTISLQYKNRLYLNTNIGLQKRDFLTSSINSDFHIGFKTSLEYAINNNLSAYVYWQKSRLLNKPNIEYEPYENLSKTLFMNNEIGAGIKAQFKNIRTDFGVNATYSSKFNRTKKINTINTKVSLGF
ncbi:MAG: hypothetical protein PF436_05725 [Prolixibacteraceae bacterium]|jgi:hypothetical protein|nr:hypothetical protein [Prolixibacteraceae bacterium]